MSIQAEINTALNAPQDAVLANAFNITIKGRDMRTLKPLAWLNDEVSLLIYVLQKFLMIIFPF